MPAEVAIIGAGAAGLCASRHLLRCGLRPLIFERSPVVGGLWHTSSGLTWDTMEPNLSRHTCAFSDFPWSDDTPTFPSRSQMQSYFEDYSKKYLENDMFRDGCTVTSVEREEDGRFKIQWKDHKIDKGAGERPQSGHFDGVIVATGFFSDPMWPEGADLTSFRGRHIHSSQYKSADEFDGKVVAVCGASFSALEIAADVARRAKRVVNILPKIPWVIPRYVPLPQQEQDSSSSSSGAAKPFVPVDFLFYRREEDAPKPELVIKDEHDNKRSHSWMRNLLGTRRQSIVGIPSDDSSPLFVAISDSYLNLVADGKIHVVEGKLDGSTGSSTLSVGNGKVSVEDIDDLISCTGYHPKLDFLDSSILDTLRYEQNNRFAPLVLCHDTYHPDIPGLGFVGFYRGVHLGHIELQARLLAGQLSGQIDIDNKGAAQDALRASEQIRNQCPRPQFPRGDFVGRMDSFAELLNLLPKGRWGKKGSMVTPALYQHDATLAAKSVEDIEREVKACSEGKNIPEIVLNALVGRWTFQRTISHYSTSSGADTTSFGAPMSEQRVVGDVRFSQQNNPNDVDALLYREDGVLFMQNSEFNVSREYEYSHNKESNTLEIHFVETDGNKGDLFLSLRFHPTTMKDVWEATSDHLCVKDLYKGTFRVEFDGIAPQNIRMEYEVNGPKKNYVACTHLQPVYKRAS